MEDVMTQNVGILIAIAMFAAVFYGISWARNKLITEETVEAKIVNKKAKNYGDGKLTYIIVLQFSGEEMKFEIPWKLFMKLEIGQVGILQHKGKKFITFRPNN
jgi:hypothetical protein